MRAGKKEEDPVLSRFLTFLADDIRRNPRNVCAVNSDLVERIRTLTSGVEIDLDSPLSDEDE